jgi:hypothetical protein
MRVGLNLIVCARFGPGMMVLIGVVLLAAPCQPVLSESVAPPLRNEEALGGLLSSRFISYGRDHNTPVFADHVPTFQETKPPFAAFTARDEYEPLQLGIYVPSGQSALSNVQISVSIDIPYHTGHLHYADVPDWLDPQDNDFSYRGRRWAMPSYLVPGNMIKSIGAGQSGGYWITFRTDATTAAGVHNGHVTIRADGVAAVTRNISVTVRHFQLPRPKAKFGFYYHIDRIGGTDVPVELNPPYRTKRYQQLYAQDMTAHGHNSVSIHGFLDLFGHREYVTTGRSTLTAAWDTGPWYDALRRTLALLEPEEYGDGKVDPARLLEEQVEIFDHAGLIHPDLPLSASGGYAIDSKSVVANTLRKLTVANQWPELVMYLRDEPPPWSNAAFPREVIDHILAFKRITNARNLTAMSGPSAASWGHIHDIWIMLAGQISQGVIAEAQRQGAEVWSYSFDFRITNPHANRYMTGLYTWGMDLGGNYAYCYQHGTVGEVNPLWLIAQERASANPGLGYIIPGPDGPIPGVGYEGRREGIDDYRYLQLLDARIAAAPATEARSQARAWLTALKQTVAASVAKGVLAGRYPCGNPWQADWYDPDFDHDPEDYRTIRETAADFIARLPAAAGELNVATVPTDYPASGWEGRAYDSSSIADCIAALKRGNKSQKRASATALSIRSDGAAAVDALANLLSDEDARIPALRALRHMGPAAAAAEPAVADLMDDPDPFVRTTGLLTLLNLGDIDPKTFLEAWGDPAPMMEYTAVEAWPHHVDQSAILAVMADSAKWNYRYEADQTPTDLAWARLGHPAGTMLPVISDTHETLEFAGTSDAASGYERNYNHSSRQCSIEVRMRLKRATSCSLPQVMIRSTGVGESSLRLTGSEGSTSIVWSLGQNNDGSPGGYAHDIDVTEWHIYRWTLTNDGSNNIEGKLYIDDNPAPVAKRNVSWDQTSRNQVSMIPGGNAMVKLDYVRWSTLGAFTPVDPKHPLRQDR